jgi:putative ABC transport system permease protein
MRWSLWQWKRREIDLDEEIAHDLALGTEERIQSGMSREEAERSSRQDFGNPAMVKEDIREMWGWASIERLLQDARYGMRVLRKHWAFAVAALFTLALGIGANTAMFSVVYAVLIEPLPYPKSDHLMFLSARDATGAAISLSYPDFIDWQQQTRAFDGLAAYQAFGFTVTARETQRFPGRTVSADFFSTLGVPPALGRDFRPEDDRPGSQPVVIITDQVWRRLFNADHDVINRTITLNSASFTVVGILPPNFRLHQPAEIFAPIGLGLRPSTRGQRKGIYAIGRLRRDATLKQAQLEAEVIAQRLARQYPDSNGGIGAAVEPLSKTFVGKTKPILIVLFGAVTFVLLIACANVGNLLLARFASRQKEIAVRVALGASGFRLLRQMLTENLLLALMGGALGLVIANWSMHAVNTLLPNEITRLKVPSVNGWVLAFTLLASVITGLLLGLVPARQAIGRASFGNLYAGLKNSGRGSGAAAQRRLLSVLVASEVALSFALLIGAGLMIRTLFSLSGVDPGFHAQNVLHTQIVLPSSQYAPDRQVEFFSGTIDRMRSIPGVAAVSAVMCLPLTGSCWSNPVEVEGQPALVSQQQSEVNFNAVAAEYFPTVGIPLLQGRDFDRHDRKDSLPVAIVNQAFVRRYLGGVEPIGRRVRERRARDETPWVTIMGVVGDVRRDRLDSPAAAEVYFPFTQNPINFMSLVVRAAENPAGPAALSSAIRTAIHSLDRAVPLQTIGTMEQLQMAGLSTRQLPAALLGLFAALALTLALLGIYGVISYSVSQRTNEIGIRLALGAERADVLYLVVRQGLKPVWAGLIAGACIAAALSRTLSGVLYGVQPTDPLTFGAVSLALLIVALLACALPARRAIGVDPLVALRYE